MNIAERTLDGEPVGTHGGKVRAASNKMDVCAGPLQSRAEETADPAGAYDGNFHSVRG
jgi:hypothetical protein